MPSLRLGLLVGLVTALLGSAACSSTVTSSLGGTATDADPDTDDHEDAGSETGEDAGEPDLGLPDAQDSSIELDGDDLPDVPMMDSDLDDVPAEDTGPDVPEPVADWPARYPTDRVQSPITDAVLDNLLDINNRGVGQQEDVFMKVGDSITEDSRALFCFAGAQVDLAQWSDLQATLDWFRGGDAAGSDPFSRDSDAVLSGRTAGWAISGTPSPVSSEMDTIAPLFSFVQYGTNDMHQGTTFESALWGYGDNMLNLVEQQLARGVIPMLITIPPRADRADADRWVWTYNAVIRGLAETYQIPLVDLHLALQQVTGFGLAGDGIHLNGGSGPCNMTASPLDHGNNTRNLILLQALDRVRRAVLLGEGGLDTAGARPLGDGSPQAPFVIPSLPYADRRDTRQSIHSDLDLYTGCASMADESGPEVLYRFETDREVDIRAMVFDRGDVDIDLHLLDASASESGCIARAHRILEARLAPGVYHFALDSFVSSGNLVRSGEYLFVVHTCRPGDPDCP